MKKSIVSSLVLVSLVALSGCSSYDEDYVEHLLSKKGVVLDDYSVTNEEEGELLGHKVIHLTVKATYKAPDGKVLCKYDFLRYRAYQLTTLEKNSFDAVDNKDKCLNLRYRNGKVKNPQVVDEIVKVREITYAKTDAAKWEAKQ